MPPETAAPAATPAATTQTAPETSQTSTPDSDLANQDSTAQATPKAPEKAQPRVKKFKLKVDGKDLDEEVNLDDEEYLTKQLQLAKAAQKRMGEYATLEKQVKSFIEELRRDPKKVLSDPNVGIDVKKLAASVIEEEIANSKKSPEQLEKEKLEAKLRQIEDDRKREREEFQRREFERHQQAAYERYDVQMAQALEKSDLPKSPYVIKKMADYMLMGLQEGLDINPSDVLPLVREEMQNDLKEMFAVMPEEVIEKLVGKDVLNRIRKKNVAKAKTSTPPTPSAKTGKDVGMNGKAEESKVSKKMTFREFFQI